MPASPMRIWVWLEGCSITYSPCFAGGTRSATLGNGGGTSPAGNPPSVFAFYMTAWVRDRADRLGGDMVRVLEGHISTLVDCQGGCERILKTPVPFVYAVHLRHITLLYLLTLPFVLVPLMSWGSALAVAAIAFGLLGIEEAGIEIEDPFGDDPNDLPLEDICAVIRRDAQMLATVGKDSGAAR